MHDDLNRDHTIKTSSERSFGLVFAVVFGVIGVWPLLSGADIRAWALALSAVFAVLALFWPVPLRPLNRLWLRFGLLLHAVVNPVIMAVLFYGTVMPIGLLMRLFGKDPLRLARDSKTASYWIVRTPPGPTPQSMSNQF